MRSATWKSESKMPQRKPGMLKNPRHVDGIREMIDFVRTQQGGPVVRESTCVDMKLQRRAPLPEIGQPRAPFRESAIDTHTYRLQKESTFDIPSHDRPPSRGMRTLKTSDTDTDPAYGSDDDLELDLQDPGQISSPAMRSNSVLSSKSTHTLAQSHSMDLGTASRSRLVPGVPTRKLSLQEPGLLEPVPGKRPTRTLPPVKQSTLERSSRGYVPHLDLSDVDPDPREWMNPDNLKRPSAPSPDTASSRDGDDSLAEDGGPIDFIDYR